MYLTIRRYEGVDTARSEEIATKAAGTLLPSLRTLPGFAGYSLIDCSERVFTSVGLFESADQAHESTRVAARWIREQDLAAAMPNSPTVTAGEVMLAETAGTAVPV
jgi:hypothetical protein